MSVVEARPRGLRGVRNGDRPPPLGVLVGTWRFSPANSKPYAIWASIDSYKRVFHHIVSEDKDRNPLPGLKSNSVKHSAIDYEPPFSGLSDKEVKLKVFEVLGLEPPVVTRVRQPGPSQRRQTIQPAGQRLIKFVKLAFFPKSDDPRTQKFFQAWVRCAAFMPPDMDGTHPSSWQELLPLEMQDDEELLWFLNLFGSIWQMILSQGEEHTSDSLSIFG